MRWLASLSHSQLLWLALVSVIGLAIVAVGVVRQKATAQMQPVAFTVAMTMKQIAPQLGVTGKSLAREFGLPLDAPKDQPLTALGVTEEQLEHVAHHLVGHRESTLKYYLFVALVLFGLVFLVRLGRPDDSPAAERATWYPRWPYIAVLIIAVALCGFALGKSPNPMEGTVKLFKSFVGLYPSVAEKVVLFLLFAALAVIGNKLICGWACPFGALQELAFSLPILRKLKRHKIPFAASNTVRCALFIVVLLLLFGIIGGQKGLVLYHFVNPFNLFNLDFESASIGITVFVALALSLGTYRPFCQFICPFGLLSWLLERISLFRVKIDRERCTNCGACIRACPLQASSGRVAGKLLPADCFSCARCLRVCPEDAIAYGLVGRTPGTHVGKH
jgi:ferredoxin